MASSDVTALIRADLEPTLLRLYGIYSAMPTFGPHWSEYEAYLAKLYPPRRDWLMVCNYGLLVSLTALIVLVVMLVTGQVS